MNLGLWDRVRDWVLLAAFIAISGIVLTSQNEPVVRGLRSIALQAAGGIEEKFAWIGNYLSALDENDRLRAENVLLSSQVARSREAIIENERLKSLLVLADTTQIRTLAARIVSKEIDRQQNLLTLDVGSNDGVEIGMAVIDQNGVLGRTVLVSPSYTRVMPYLNTEFRLSAKIQPNQAAGIIRWDGRDPDFLNLDQVIKTEPVEPGQEVVTSGYSGIFPSGYPIGVVTSVEIRTGRNDLNILVRPYSRYTIAEHAFVILYKPDPERIELESIAIE
ncbi:MAG: rod shape-determining protein MreC [Rhodothermales bacterium]|nr:rod shape-determining protein MreC [Rhodothermales bacterium]